MSGTETPNLDLQYLAPSQSQPEVLINDAWNKIDAALEDSRPGIAISDATASPPLIARALELQFEGAGVSIAHETGGRAIITIPGTTTSSSDSHTSSDSGSRTIIKQVTFTNGTSALVAPTNDVALYIEQACTIQKVVLLTQGGSGSAIVDLWKAAIDAYPPTIANSICASDKPTISSEIIYQDAVLTGWTTELAAGDVLLVHLQSVSTFTNLVLAIQLGL